jgi:hypothetical protein
MRQIKVEAYEVPSGLAFHAKLGDTLIVVNGVCVGVQQVNGGSEVLRLAAPKRPKIGRSTDVEEDERILAVLKEHGPLNVAHILDALKLDPKDDRRRLYGQRVNRMEMRGVLRVVKADKHKVRQRRYEIKP